MGEAEVWADECRRFYLDPARLDDLNYLLGHYAEASVCQHTDQTDSADARQDFVGERIHDLLDNYTRAGKALLAERDATIARLTDDLEAEKINVGFWIDWVKRHKADLAGANLVDCVWVSPQRLGGKPCIGGTRISVATVARYVAGGGGVETARVAYPDLTRAQVLIACWHAAVYGDTRGWATWAEEHEQAMWSGKWDQVPDPPREPDWVDDPNLTAAETLQHFERLPRVAVTEVPLCCDGRSHYCKTCGGGWPDGEPYRQCTYACTHGQPCVIAEPRPWHAHDHSHIGVNRCTWSTKAPEQNPHARCDQPSQHLAHRWGNPAHWCDGAPVLGPQVDAAQADSTGSGE